jgi:hypothetical protein
MRGAPSGSHFPPSSTRLPTVTGSAGLTHAYLGKEVTDMYCVEQAKKLSGALFQTYYSDSLGGSYTCALSDNNSFIIHFFACANLSSSCSRTAGDQPIASPELLNLYCTADPRKRGWVLAAGPVLELRFAAKSGSRFFPVQPTPSSIPYC